MTMGFFRKLFGHDGTPSTPATSMPAPSPAPAPRRVSYDPNLIQSMLNDHAQLGQIFSRVGDAQKAGTYSEIRPLLIQFKSRLEAHVLTENVRFYTYLEQSLAGDPSNAAVMHDFRREMNAIARGVVDFVKKYQACGFAPEQRREFADDYAAVGKLLEQRLDNEETNLYPLYTLN
ncbi:MAG TPA: hemerythrin domain-containing protein [Rhodanobacteraceae bacterium]|nr:hemerythrin domain-containing protein [Rhodanobacteraceae bacterium]